MAGNGQPKRQSRVWRILRAAVGRVPQASQDCRTQLDAALKGLRATSEVNRIVVQNLQQQVDRNRREAAGESPAHA